MGQTDADPPAIDALIRQAVAGDEEALGTLLNRYEPQLRGELTISPQWRSVLDVDDVIQVTFVEAYLHIGRFRMAGPGSFLAWLRRIAWNNLRDAIKALSREKRPPPGKRIQAEWGRELCADLPEEDYCSSETPSRIMASREHRALVESAIEDLPPSYATAIRLHDLDGRSGPEVAAAMNCSRGAAFMILERARERLREKLGSESRFFGDRR